MSARKSRLEAVTIIADALKAEEKTKYYHDQCAAWDCIRPTGPKVMEGISLSASLPGF